MLRDEIKRLEQLKNVQSTLKTGAKLKPLDRNDELVQLRGENGRLKNTIKCMEIELDKKEEHVANLMSGCLGAPDERLEEKELRIAELEERVEELEKENFKVTQGFKKSQFSSPDEGMIKDITK